MPQVLTPDTVTPTGAAPETAPGTLASRSDVEKALEALMGGDKPEAAKPEAKTDAAKTDAAKTDDNAEPEEGLTHGQKSFQGKLNAEATRLKAEREAIQAERADLEKLKAGKSEESAPEGKAETGKTDATKTDPAKPEAKDQEKMASGSTSGPGTASGSTSEIKLPRLDESEWDSPEFVANFNTMAETFERSYRQMSEGLSSQIAQLEARLSKAEAGARVAEGLAQREVQNFMTSEGERAAKLFTAKYDALTLTPDQAWKAVSDYAKLNPDFQATDQASYTDAKWVEILERAYALDILRLEREAKEKEAKSKTPRPPVTAAGTSTVNAKGSGSPSALLTREDTARALEAILKTA